MNLILTRGMAAAFCHVRKILGREAKSLKKSHLLRVWVGAENFYKSAFLFNFNQRTGDLCILVVAVTIDKKEVFPRFFLIRAGFDAGHIQLVFIEWSQSAMERADFIGNAKHQAGTVLACRWTALAAKDIKAGRVAGAVLDVFFKYFEPIAFGSQCAGDGGAPLFPSGEFGCASGGGSFHEFDIGKMCLKIVPALGDRLGMRINLSEIPHFAVADEALLDAQDNLGNDFQFTFYKHIQRVGNHAFSGIFHGNNSVIRATFADFREYVGDGFVRGII